MAPPEVVDGKLSPSGTVGFFGCEAAGRLVRVGVAEGLAKGPKNIDAVRCPACGNEHRRLAPSWRKPTALDQGRLPEIVVDAEGEVA